MSEVDSAERQPLTRHVRHWCAVATITLCGLAVAEQPVLPHTRDRVYLWLQQHLHRSQRNVIVVAIDDDEYWRGEPGGVSPLDRTYLGNLITMVATADPSVIGLDVGLETVANRPLSQPTRDFLRAVDDAAAQCPVVLSRTLRHCANSSTELCRAHDVYDNYGFANDVTFGHTSSAYDIRQIPTRVKVRGQPSPEDSFALAVFRRESSEVPPVLEDLDHPWPYSLFLPHTAFTPKELRNRNAGLLTVQALRAATPAQRRQWLRHQIVLIGGVWHATPHGGRLADAHETPRGSMPGVMTHANYVQSLLWDAMYGVPRPWRISVEVFLSLLLSIVFLRVHGWRRYAFILVCLVVVVFSTWLFTAAIGVFFDMVVPIVFLGVHAIWEEASENLRFGLRRRMRHPELVLTTAALLMTAGIGFLFIQHELSVVGERLAVEDRLQVVDAEPLRVDAPVVAHIDPDVTEPENPSPPAPPVRPRSRREAPAPRKAQRQQVPVPEENVVVPKEQPKTEIVNVPPQPRLELQSQPAISDPGEAEMQRRLEMAEVEEARRAMASAEVERMQREPGRHFENFFPLFEASKEKAAESTSPRDEYEIAREIALTAQARALRLNADKSEAYKEGVDTLKEAIAKAGSKDYRKATELAEQAYERFNKASGRRGAAVGAFMGGGGRSSKLPDAYKSARRSPPKVLREGAPLSSLLPLFDGKARIVHDCLVLPVPPSSFTADGALKPAVLQHLSIIGSAYGDDERLYVSVTVAPSSAPESAVATVAPPRIAALITALGNAGVPRTRMAGTAAAEFDPASVEREVSLLITLCRNAP